MSPYYDLRWFLISWMFLSDAGSTAQGFAPLYATEVLQLSGNWQLISAGVGIFGCYCGIKMFKIVLDRKFCGVKVLLLTNFTLMGVACLIVSQIDPDASSAKIQLMIGIFVMGLNWGSMNSFARSLTAMIVPYNQQAPFFALYELTQKGSSWFGPLCVTILTIALGKENFGAVVIGTVMLEALIGMPIFIFLFDMDRACRQRLAEQNNWRIVYNDECCGCPPCCGTLLEQEQDADYVDDGTCWCGLCGGDDEIANRERASSQVPMTGGAPKEAPRRGWRSGVGAGASVTYGPNTQVLCRSRLNVLLETWKPPDGPEERWNPLDREKNKVGGLYELVREVPDQRDMHVQTDASWRCLPDSSYDARLNYDSCTDITKTTVGRDYPEPRIDDIMGPDSTELIYRNTENDDTYLVKDRGHNWGFVYQDESRVDDRGNPVAPGRLSVMFSSKVSHPLDSITGNPGELWEMTRNERGVEVDETDRVRILLDGGRMVKCFNNFSFVDPTSMEATGGCFEADRSQYLVINRDITQHPGNYP